MKVDGTNDERSLAIALGYVGTGAAGPAIPTQITLVDPRTYGAVLDEQGVSDAAVAGGSLSTVTSATAAFTSADTGKTYTLATTTGTITKGTLTYVSATSCTMSVAAGGAMSGARLIWGTNDHTAWVNALAAAVPGQTVAPTLASYRSLIDGQLDVPIGVRLGIFDLGPFSPDTPVWANTWGPTLVLIGDTTNPFVLLEQGAAFGDFIMFDAGQVPPTATTPIAKAAFIQMATDPLPWSSRETRITGCRVGSPYLCNPYVGIYIKGGGHLIDAPQIGGLYRSVIIDHTWDFVSVRRIKVDRLACVEDPGLGAAGLNVWYLNNAWALYVYRADGFKVHELSTYGVYGGIAMDDSPDGAQDPNAFSCGYGMVGILDIDTCVIGIYAKATNSPGLIVGEAIIGPNTLGYGTTGSYGVWTTTGGSLAPLVVIGSWAVRGTWTVGVAVQDAGTLIVPGTNPGSGAGDAEGAVALRYTFSTTTADADPGAGKLRLSNTTQSLSVTVRADLLDANGADVTTALDIIGDQTGTTKGYLRIQNSRDPTRWLLFDATALASPAGYRNITVSVRAGSPSGVTSPFANGDPLTLVFVPSTVGISGAAFATPAIVLGTAAAAGSAGTVIRSDSTVVAFDTTAPTTQAFADAAAVGTVALASRRDHKHGMPTVAVSENYLGGNVTMTLANTFYDGPSLSLVAGTYLVTGHVFLVGGANWFTVKLWDGVSSIYDAAGAWNPTGTTGITVPVSGVMVLASTTTIKISAAHNTTGGVIEATPFTDNAGLTNKASHLVALRIA